LIVDKDGVLLRVQVKTGRFRNGAILFHTYSTHSHRNGIACRPYTNEIEFFGVYCPELNSVIFSRSATTNRQNSQVRWAQPYLIDSAPIPDLVVGAKAADGVSGFGPERPS
jgi:hypothetical protein